MYRAGAVAARLGVAPTTIREWSRQFQDYLSPAAGRLAGGGQRRYSDDDVALLAHARDLLARGLTFVEARAALDAMTPEQRATMPTPPTPATPPLGDEQRAALVVGDLVAALNAAHVGEVSALRAALDEARARADLLQAHAGHLQQELDELRAAAARPALPAPEATPAPPLIPSEATPESPQPPAPAPVPWWKRLLGG